MRQLGGCGISSGDESGFRQRSSLPTAIFFGTPLTRGGVTAQIQVVTEQLGIQRNSKGRLCELYILAKTKCRLRGKLLFMQLAAMPAPFVNPTFLWVRV